MLTGQNGILNRAAEAKEKTEVAQKDENEKMQGYEDIINKYTGNLQSKEETKPILFLMYCFGALNVLLHTSS